MKTEFSIKKVIALSFLFLATTIVLIHAIIPHHHHKELSFMLTEASHEHVCSDHHQSNNTKSAGKCDYPPCQGAIEQCVLSTIYVKFGNNNRPASQQYDFNFDLSPCVFTLSPDYSAPHIADDVGLPFRQKPYLISYLSEYISQSLGLRAPPFC